LEVVPAFQKSTVRSFIFPKTRYVLEKDPRIEGGDLLFKRGNPGMGDSGDDDYEDDSGWAMKIPQNHHYMAEFCTEVG
jgi:hypothetical protein